MTHKKKWKCSAILCGKGFWHISRSGSVIVDESSISLAIFGIAFLTMQKEDIVAIDNAESTTNLGMGGMKVVGIKITHTKKQSPTFVYFLNFARYNLDSLKFYLREFGFEIN